MYVAVVATTIAGILTRIGTLCSPTLPPYAKFPEKRKSTGSYALSVMVLARALALGIGWYLVDCTLDPMVLQKNEEILRSDQPHLATSLGQDGPS